MKTLKILTITTLLGASALVAQGMHGNNGEKGNCSEPQQTQMQAQHGQQMQKQNKSERKMQRRGKHRSPNKRINRLFRSLGLTNAQKAELKEIRMTMNKARMVERESFKGKQGLKNFITVDGFNKEAFLETSIHRATAMTKVRADMLEKMIAILTPEQRIALTERLNRKGKREGRRQ